MQEDKTFTISMFDIFSSFIALWGICKIFCSASVNFEILRKTVIKMIKARQEYRCGLG